MLILKKLTKQCTSCPSASIMILQKGIVISLERRHLALTLLASISMCFLIQKHVFIQFLNNQELIIYFNQIDVILGKPY